MSSAQIVSAAALRAKTTPMSGAGLANNRTDLPSTHNSLQQVSGECLWFCPSAGRGCSMIRYASI